MTYDLAIIGGGPAGASAAVFAARAGLKTLVVDADKGMTRRAMLNNHLGFPEGITGPELVDKGRAHAERSGAEWAEATVKSLTPAEGGFALATEDGQSWQASEVLLTTGISPSLAADAGIDTTPGTEPRIATIVKVDGEGRTSLPGVWAAGTAGGVSVHTIITAGDGARVAINIISGRNGERYVDHDMMPRPTE